MGVEREWGQELGLLLARSVSGALGEGAQGRAMSFICWTFQAAWR
jgi:hypothetical protein